ncbi:hypothetical protein [Natrinema caseinilyticum]|uniref:hypothetical protein n=1 Tax=Natrinema caseinilyticum TaxID=2961570 RepID=UPI0020C35AC1|nr:hypothetical protein [Natrinema caseinilyticum]
MYVFNNKSAVSEDRTVAAMTAMAIIGVAVSMAFGGATSALLEVTYYATNSGAAAGGASAGTGAVVGAGIGASSLSGLALAGAVTGGAGLVVGAGV